MPGKQRAGKLASSAGVGAAAPLVRHWLRQQQSERLGTLSEIRVLLNLLAGLRIQSLPALPGANDSVAVLQEMCHRSERLLGRLSPRAAPGSVSECLVQFVSDWRAAHPRCMSHLSIAEELGELTSPYSSLLIDGVELFLDRLIASGGAPRFSLVAVLDPDATLRLTLCSFGQMLELGDGTDLSVATLALQLQSLGGQLAYSRDAAIGSVLQLQLPL